MRLDPYPAYKPSGVEWLGDVPAHWEVRRLKYSAPIRVSKLDRKPEEATYVGLEHVESQTGRLLLDNQPENVDSIVASFEAGDVLFGKLRPYLAKSARPDFNGVATSEILALRPLRDFLQSYAMYCLLNEAYVRWVNVFTYGARMPRVSPDQVGISYMPLPPSPEQRAIATFLDRETAKIDALVAKKERLTELLHEKRAALISRAVTRGLDADAPMKDSGVEWLGQVPAHWEVEYNKWLFRESDLRSPNGEEELLTVSHITGVTPRSEKPDVTMIEAESLAGYKICRSSDLAINTMWAWMGALGVAFQDGIVSPSYNVYRIDQDRLIPHYYEYLCRSLMHTTEIARYSKGVWSSRLRLYPEAFWSIRTALPPLTEQHAIAEHLDRETAKLDALAAKVREAVERLKELRAALISAAVTGRIDVRDVAA